MVRAFPSAGRRRVRRRVEHYLAVCTDVGVRAASVPIIVTACLRVASRPMGSMIRFIRPTAMLGGGFRRSRASSAVVTTSWGSEGGDRGGRGAGDVEEFGLRGARGQGEHA